MKWTLQVCTDGHGNFTQLHNDHDLFHLRDCWPPVERREFVLASELEEANARAATWAGIIELQKTENAALREVVKAKDRLIEVARVYDTIRGQHMGDGYSKDLHSAFASYDRAMAALEKK